MKTPIVDFVDSYVSSDISRFHMPGHKGRDRLGFEKYDITEIGGADTLYSADGIILESENNASRLFGTAHSFYSTEGATLAIKAMVALACGGCDGRPLIFAARNAHKSFVYACALLDADVKWMYSSSTEHLCECMISAEAVREALETADKKPCAVYITSPDYLGNIADVKGIAEVCHSYDVPLLVDNAHGAYLKFLPESCHPIDEGADMCCDSAHKTLPVLTGGAYLHISKRADRRYVSEAPQKLSLFASTSPSYLILRSLDLCNRYISDGYTDLLTNAVKKTALVAENISRFGFDTRVNEPLKLTLYTDHRGKEIVGFLREKKIEPEFFDDEIIVFMTTPDNTEEDFARLEAAFCDISSYRTTESSIDHHKERILCPEAVMSIRDAIFSASEIVDVKKAKGRICASPCVSCPPAVPIAVSGELIDDDVIAEFLRFGIEKISVIK